MKDLQTLDDIFYKSIFRIPDYQRGYAWGEKQLIEFWDDLISLDMHRSHYTGVISIKKVPEEVWLKWNDEKWLIKGGRHDPYYIVDGQQRITTISIFLQCLIEAVSEHPQNVGKNERDIFLGDQVLSRIIEHYIVVTEPQHRINKAYKFGYAVDNPSFDFLRHNIFQEPNSGTISETFYTLNLENAKQFFKENIARHLEQNQLGSLGIIYEKLTQNFLFNVYEIDDNFDEFVAFETMNNRGKRLSDLELLKNRLIYLSTLYPSDEVPDDVKEKIRKKINDTWGEIYNQLGRNKRSPLNDDEFLRAHWIMYFKYSRVKGNDYIHYLLDDYFSPKNIFEKLDVSTKQIDHIEELTDADDSDEDEIAEQEIAEQEIAEQEIAEQEIAEQEIASTRRAKRTITDISDYVDSLKVASKIWYATFFPNDTGELSEEEKVLMDKINRVKISYFRPLIMAALIRTSLGDIGRKRLLIEIERFIFICLRVSRAQSNYRSSAYYRAARSIYLCEMTIDSVIEELENDLQWTFYEDGGFKISYFEGFISKKLGPNGGGFYDWNDLQYFLFEYEEKLKESRNQPKFVWQNFVKSEKDKVSIEHIYPQTATSDYWQARFSSFSEKEQQCLRGSLGNLLPLSLSINSSLQNDDFPAKKVVKKNEQNKLVRSGYEDGSYSELEVAKEGDWTAIEIVKRGLMLLAFMETRWGIDLGSRSNKLAILQLSFLDDNKNVL